MLFGQDFNIPVDCPIVYTNTLIIFLGIYHRLSD